MARIGSFGNLVFVAFVAAQVCDGVLTYHGVARFGPQIEANPVLAWYVYAFGAGAALLGAKIFAVLCGMGLHLLGMHRTVGLLTASYVGAALIPWIEVLWP